MMEFYNESVRIEVNIRLPWAKNELRYQYAIDKKQAREGLVPLPKEREFDPYAAFEAQRQNDRRHTLVDMVSRQIAGALMNACESQDTDHGYPKVANGS